MTGDNLGNTQHSIDKVEVFSLGSWLVEPASGTLRRKDEVVHLAPKVMELLMTLARNQGHVVSKDQLMTAIWPDTFVAETALTRSISELRHSLDDHSGDPIYIETIPKKGYRLLAPVEEYRESGTKSWRVKWLLWTAAIVACVLLLISGGNLLVGHLWEDETPSADQLLVVLPFDRGETDHDSDILTIGVVENIVESLSGINDLNVVSGTSLIPFENDPEGFEDFAERLGNPKVLEGSFRQTSEDTSEDISISLRLSDTLDQEVLWSGVYSVSSENWGDVATEIILQVAAAMNVKLSSAEVLEITQRAAHNIEAHQYSLMGDYFRKTEIPEYFEKAVGYYEQAIQKNPSYARAYAGLAEACMGLGEWGGDEEWALKAQVAVSKALALDNQIPESHIANGIFLRTFRSDFIAAEAAFKEAIRMNPGHSNARREYGLLLMRNLRRSDEALFQLQEAARLDPLLDRNYHHLFQLYYIRGDYFRAMEYARREFDLDPMNPRANRNIALAYFFLGENTLALKWAKKSVELLAFSPKTYRLGRNFQLLTLLYLYEGRFDEASATSLLLQSLDPGSSDSLATSGVVALYSKNYAEAESCFSEALELEPTGYVWSTGIRLSTFLGYVLRYMDDHAGSQRALELSTRLNRENNILVYDENIWPPMAFQDVLAVYSIRGDIEEEAESLALAVENGWNAYALVERNPLFMDAFKEQELQQISGTVKLRVETMRQRVEMQWPDQERDSLFP